MRTHEVERNFSCDRCDKTFRQKKILVQHALVHIKNPDSLKLFECKNCGKCFNVQSNLKQHIKLKHLQEKRFFCDQCGKGFCIYYKCYLQYHLKVHGRLTQNDSKVEVVTWKM